MKEAIFYRELEGGKVQCQLCPHFCVIKEGEVGKCRSRKNFNGSLYSLVYGKPCAISVDKIEKKPLFHFLPGSETLSVGTTGCNLKCSFCQNWQTSQASPEDIPTKEITPDKFIKRAKASGCKSVSFTYNEPMINFEFVYEAAKIAKSKGIKTVIVSNGFVNPEPLKELIPYLNAANIDFKSFDNEFYKNVCGGRVKPVLETMKTLKENGVWVEVTNLLIPNYNDKEIRELCEWVRVNLGKDTPLHISRFFPMYKMSDVKPTPVKDIMNAKAIAEEYLDFVYAGNLLTDINTYCPKCGQLVVKRGESQKECKCGYKISGVWE